MTAATTTSGVTLLLGWPDTPWTDPIEAGNVHDAAEHGARLTAAQVFDILRALADWRSYGSDRTRTLRTLASRTDLPSAAYLTLLAHFDAGDPAISLLARNPALTDRVLRRMLPTPAPAGSRGGQRINWQAITHPALSAARIPELLDDEAPVVRALAASRPDLTSPAAARRLRRETDPTALTAYANNQALDDDLRVLALLTRVSLPAPSAQRQRTHELNARLLDARLSEAPDRETVAAVAEARAEAGIS